MKTRIIALSAFFITLICFPTVQAVAYTVYDNGWYYAEDASSDVSGDSVYEIYGLAVKQTQDSIFVAVNANMPVEGIYKQVSWCWYKHIGWGDLIFNTTGEDLLTASNQGVLAGIKFGPNDSGVSEVGVYSNVSLMSIGGINDGYDDLKQYYDNGNYEVNTFGTDFPTKEAAYTYFYGEEVAQDPTHENTPTLNAIESGAKVGDITMKSAGELAAESLDFGNINAPGSETFGFQFSSSSLGSNSFDISLFVECANDGVALRKYDAQVPDLPLGAVQAMVLFFGFAAFRIMKKEKE